MGLIDEDVFKTLLNEQLSYGDEDIVAAVYAALKDTPTVDAVKVVKCKDCAKDGLFTCTLSYIENHNLCFINHSTDFFCAAGKLKEGADNG